MAEKPSQTRASTTPPADTLAFAGGVLDAEAEAIGRIALDERFVRAVELVRHAADGGGAVVVSGLGKSGLIGAKLSATFASTGTPSHFLHPTEAMHGDLGRVRRGDVVLMLSFGGSTEEVIALASVLRPDGIPTIAVVGDADCELGRLCTVALPIGDVTEACPLNLAPTASTTAMLALGDALALAVSRARAFTVDDFKKNHPGGGLGRQLMPVLEAMRFRAGDNLPLIHEGLTVRSAYDEAAHVAERSGLRRAGALVVVDAAGKLVGIFTDGDLRRHVLEERGTTSGAGGGGGGLMERPMREVMTRKPRRLRDDALVRDAVAVVRELRIDEVPVVDAEDRPVGLIDVQDLVALKVIQG